MWEKIRNQSAVPVTGSRHTLVTTTVVHHLMGVCPNVVETQQKWPEPKLSRLIG